MTPAITTPDGQLAYRLTPAARMLGISRSTLERLITDRRIRAVAVSPRVRVIARDELTRYLLENEVPGGGAA